MAYYPVQPLPDTNARTPTITVRPASTALLTIDSEDRYKDYLEARDSPTSPYDFVIRKNENLMAGFFTRLAVTEINFPWTIPNINLKTQTIDVSWNATATGNSGQGRIALPSGFYTPYQLATVITAKVQALSPPDLSGFVMTYGRSLGTPALTSNTTGPRFWYRVPPPGSVTGYSILFNPLPYNSTDYPYPPQTKQLFDILGFKKSNSSANPGGFYTALGSGDATFCQAIRYVDIVSNVLTSVSSLKDNTSQPVVRDMLCRLYLGDGGGTGQSTVQADASGAFGVSFCPPGCAPMTIYRNFTNPKQIAWIPNQNIQGSVGFQIYDDTGDLLENSFPFTLGSGAPDYPNLSTNWSMTLLVTEN